MEASTDLFLALLDFSNLVAHRFARPLTLTGPILCSVCSRWPPLPSLLILGSVVSTGVA